jgi:hypothetical protein
MAEGEDTKNKNPSLDDALPVFTQSHINHQPQTT